MQSASCGGAERVSLADAMEKKRLSQGRKVVMDLRQPTAPMRAVISVESSQVVGDHLQQASPGSRWRGSGP